VIDRDTKNISGMPDIGQTILEKIKKSAIVVADLTLINPAAVRRPDERPVSNPNVLFELGYAFGKLGPQAMIGIFNTASGEIEELPFDLRPKRLMTYRLVVGDKKAEPREKLVNDLAGAIKQCLGETEIEQVARNTQVYAILSDVWLLGTEIAEWQDNNDLPAILQRILTAAEEVPELLIQSGYSRESLSIARRSIISKLRNAGTLTFNKENWPGIAGLISDAGDFASIFIHNLVGYKVDRQHHDQLVDRVMRIPTELDGHLESLQNFELRVLDLQNLSYELRTIAFKALIPQHPQFTNRLLEISLAFRQHILRWKKNAPRREEASNALREIRDSLTTLNSQYIVPLALDSKPSPTIDEMAKV